MGTEPGMADPQKVREYWTEVVRGAADRGKLEKIPTRIARTPREKAQAKNQNYWITRKTIGAFHENYNKIKWDGDDIS